MPIRRLAAPAAIALVSGVLAASLAGCAPTPAPAVTVTVAPPVDTPTAPPVAVPAKLVISLTDVQVVDSAGATLATAAFTDGAAMKSTLLQYLGTVKGKHNSQYADTSYSWGPDNAVTLLVVDGDSYSSISFGTDTFNGLQLVTDDGISVGSDRAAVTALDPYDPQYDMDGDGGSDFLGVEQQEAGSGGASDGNGPALDYIMVIFDGDTVQRINDPSNNYGDV